MPSGSNVLPKTFGIYYNHQMISVNFTTFEISWKLHINVGNHWRCNDWIEIKSLCEFTAFGIYRQKMQHFGIPAVYLNKHINLDREVNLMADVYAIFGTLLALGIAFPGLLTAWWLLFPNKVEKARQRFEAHPWKTLGSGVGHGILTAVPIIILFSIPFPFSKFLGAVALFGTFATASIGAAGLASLMANQLKGRTDTKISETGFFVRGAVTLELAAAFPFIGWFIFIPLCILASYGAAIHAILKRNRVKQDQIIGNQTTSAAD